MFRRKREGKPPLDEEFWRAYYEEVRANEDNVRDKDIRPGSALVATLRQTFGDGILQALPSGIQMAVALGSPYAKKDTARAYDLLRFFEMATRGHFVTTCARTKLDEKIVFRGAENWGNVMCYLDLLLFAMFANIESFEPMLFHGRVDGDVGGDAGSEAEDKRYLTKRLATLLRLYVSMLRGGQLVTSDITKRLCETLAKLGFEEAMSGRQQDCAPLFQFLTEVLDMPLLSLTMEIQHGGKFNKEDDQKITKERMLFVSVPEDDQEEEVLLEECLEAYFSNSIEVKRELERRMTLELSRSSTKVDEKPSYTHYENLSEGSTAVFSYPEGLPEDSTSPHHIDSDVASCAITISDSLKEPFPDAEVVDLPRGGNTARVGELGFANVTPSREPRGKDGRTTPDSPSTRDSMSGSARDASVSDSPRNRLAPSRTASVTSYQSRSATLDLRSIVLPLESRLSFKQPYVVRERSLSIWSTSGKTREVLLPAWMFLQLLPFYTSDSTNHISPSSVHFVSRRPILPICLKRFAYRKATGKFERLKSKVVIPPVIDLPNFIADTAETRYKLVLESAVCHRGTSMNSGHFVCAARKKVIDARTRDAATEQSTWHLFDDLNKKERVTEMTFREIFDTEWPYMLFYRMVGLEDGREVIPPVNAKTRYWGDSDKANEANVTSEVAEATELPERGFQPFQGPKAPQRVSKDSMSFEATLKAPKVPPVSEAPETLLEASEVNQKSHVGTEPHSQMLLVPEPVSDALQKKSVPHLYLSRNTKSSNSVATLEGEELSKSRSRRSANEILDIRNRYYWYLNENSETINPTSQITDETSFDYYKEEPFLVPPINIARISNPASFGDSSDDERAAMKVQSSGNSIKSWILGGKTVDTDDEAKPEEPSYDSDVVDEPVTNPHKTFWKKSKSVLRKPKTGYTVRMKLTEEVPPAIADEAQVEMAPTDHTHNETHRHHRLPGELKKKRSKREQYKDEKCVIA
ncbi:hypothetical protein BABINDRAFT_159774 [Babjeviella inositovora NRRL Y-12698]|uniref:ubiquitinyl hydrolase 1 n=1 Tax=Babjeviella inositovora NRRL Y-12698 TaxID=984486 RepID=A0A1E3QV08_9ASCO|nr:uncharacterized protein BABINDRAFT_159774 [Babjeviella inositovora NRRL Y-12698]ODQ81495.1 hypothetical protein BABINDRAFT_159774 [Babjeviella inositovora NRRL Y-12698]